MSGSLCLSVCVSVLHVSVHVDHLTNWLHGFFSGCVRDNTLCKHVWTEFPEWSRRDEKQRRGVAATEGFTFRPYVAANSLLFLNRSSRLISQSRENQMDLRASGVKIYLCSNPEGKQTFITQIISSISWHFMRFVGCVCHVWLFMLCADSVVERRALRETVFPKLGEHCRHTLGLDVRVSPCCLKPHSLQRTRLFLLGGDCSSGGATFVSMFSVLLMLTQLADYLTRS